MRHIRFVPCLLVVSGLGVALMQGPTQAAPAAPTAGKPSAHQLVEAIGKARGKLDARPEVAGVQLNADQTRVQVFATGKREEIKEAVRAELGDEVDVLPARVNATELQRLRAAVKRDAAKHDAAAFGPLALYSNASKGAVTVYVDTTDLDAAQDHYDAAYGPGSIDVQYKAAGELVPFSRINDAPAWNAGDFITSDGFGDCSSGFGIRGRSSGLTYLLSASHCYNSTNRIHNGWQIPVAGQAPELMGEVAFDYSASGYDVVAIRASASGLAWRTQTATEEGVRGSVVSANGAVVNGPACFSGAPSGERCGRVREVNLDMRFRFGSNTGPWLQNLVRAISDGRVETGPTSPSQRGATLAGNGDSGGPVYSVQSNGLNALGTIVGTDPGQELPCHRLPERGQCSDSVYFHDMSSILATANASLA